MINRMSLTDEIQARLRQRILAGELESGQRITEQGVAQEMGTSPGPVREAFVALQKEGLLISLPRRGTFVSSISELESRVAYEVRARIEPYAAELAMVNADQAIYDLMTAAINGMRAAAKESNLRDFIQYDLAFHATFYDHSGTELLKSIWASTSVKIQRFIAMAASYYVPDLTETAEQHLVLLTLFRAKDVEGLRVAIPNHVGDLWRRIKAAESSDEPPIGR
jgi:DNA-binding GntR family transcriptional regulator